MWLGYRRREKAQGLHYLPFTLYQQICLFKKKKRSNLYICFVLYTSMQAVNFSNIKLINFRSLSPRKASYNSHASQPPVYISLEQYACALKKNPIKMHDCHLLTVNKTPENWMRSRDCLGPSQVKSEPCETKKKNHTSMQKNQNLDGKSVPKLGSEMQWTHVRYIWSFLLLSLFLSLKVFKNLNYRFQICSET